MQDIGVNDQYLILKTVPFGMDGATQEEWNIVIEQTKGYREAVITELLKISNPDFVLADGENAYAEALRILQGTGIKVINIKRSVGSHSFGLKDAAREIAKLKGYQQVNISSKIANIPRSHLSFYSRVWRGTSG